MQTWHERYLVGIICDCVITITSFVRLENSMLVDLFDTLMESIILRSISALGFIVSVYLLLE